MGGGAGRRWASRNWTPSGGHRMLLVREAPNTGHCCSFRVLQTTRWPAPAAELTTHFGCRMHPQTQQEMLPCWLDYPETEGSLQVGSGGWGFSVCTQHCSLHIAVLTCLARDLSGTTAAWWEWVLSLSDSVRGISCLSCSSGWKTVSGEVRGPCRRQRISYYCVNLCCSQTACKYLDVLL